MSNLKLHKALKVHKKKTQQKELEIYGSLGIPLGGRKLTDVPDRPSFVYVRLRDNQNEVVQAFNNRVTSSYNLPVILHREGSRYVVDSVNTQRYQSNWNNSAAYLPRHGTNHSFYPGGGGDVTWVYSRQIMPYLVYPESTTTGSSLKMSPHTFLDPNNQWKVVGGTGTPSLLQYRPTGGNDAIMGLLYLDAPTGNPKLLINSGTPFSNLLTGTGDIYPYIPVPNINTQIPLAAIRLSSGTNYINWDNLYDVRQWLRVVASGTSSGGGGGGVDTIGFVGLADGLPIGTGTVLNVHGAAFTRSGTVFDLNITGSAATLVPVSGTFVSQDSGQTLGSVTTLNATHGITASVSGSVAQLQANEWIVADGIFSCISTDSPIFNVSISTNITGSIGLGNRIRLNQSSQNKYFLVHGVGVTGSTSYLNLYGGTDYSLITGSAISSPYYSTAKAPFGFPLNPDKWTVPLINDTSNAVQNTPTGNTWYNVGTLTGTFPIGVWRSYYELAAEVNATLAVATNVGYRVTLSTANNSESDAAWTSVKTSAMPIITGGTDRTSFHREKLMNILSKVTYFLNILTGAAGTTSINIRGDVITTIVKAISAYL